MIRSDVLTSLRMAGQVVRYHTWPTLQRQTVAEHTWQLLRIFYNIWDATISYRVTRYIMWHDAGEIVTGDPPYPVKARNPDMKVAYDRAEAEALRGLGVEPPEISDSDKLRVKCAELIEMAEFGHVELLMGNKFAEPIIVDTTENLWLLSRQLSHDDNALIRDYLARSKSLWPAGLGVLRGTPPSLVYDYVKDDDVLGG